MALEDILPGSPTTSAAVTSSIAVILMIAVLSMVVIQLLKDLLPLRRWYQRRWMRWKLGVLATEGRRRSTDVSKTPSNKIPDPGEAERQLCKLATSSDVDAFYDLPIEQMCGQMNAALAVAIDHPGHYPDLLLCFASGADPQDVATVFEQSRKTTESSGVSDGGAPPIPQAFIDSRNRVANQVQRTIDGIQISAGFRWKWALQLISILLSFAIAASVLIGERVVVILVAGLLGGFFAPVLRDILAALQSMRARR
jgi:hypothetical protein